MSKNPHGESFRILLHNITWLRAHYGYSKARMAEILKVGISTINQIEAGVIPPRLSTEILFRIHRHFGIHPADLISQRLPY